MDTFGNDGDQYCLNIICLKVERNIEIDHVRLSVTFHIYIRRLYMEYTIYT